jgi:hypothetical protein
VGKPDGRWLAAMMKNEGPTCRALAPPHKRSGGRRKHEGVTKPNARVCHLDVELHSDLGVWSFVIPQAGRHTVTPL